MKEIDFDSSSCSDKGIAFMLGGGVEGGMTRDDVNFFVRNKPQK